MPVERSLTRQSYIISAHMTLTDSSVSSVKPGPIAGGVVGGVLFLGGVAFLVVYFLRRRRKQHLREAARYPNSTFSASSDNPRSPFGEEYAVPYSASSRDDVSIKSVTYRRAHSIFI